MTPESIPRTPLTEVRVGGELLLSVGGDNPLDLADVDNCPRSHCSRESLCCECLGLVNLLLALAAEGDAAADWGADYE